MDLPTPIESIRFRPLETVPRHERPVVVSLALWPRCTNGVDFLLLAQSARCCARGRTTLLFYDESHTRSETTNINLRPSPVADACHWHHSARHSAVSARQKPHVADAEDLLQFGGKPRVGSDFHVLGRAKDSQLDGGVLLVERFDDEGHAALAGVLLHQRADTINVVGAVQAAPGT